MGGLVNLLMVLALLYILIKIPFWILAPLRVSSGRSLVAGMARTYLMGRAVGAIAGRIGVRSGRGSASASAARARGTAARSRTATPADPPLPAPIRDWGGLDGIFAPDAISRRLRAQHSAERARAGTSSRVQQPRFQQTAPQTPTHDLAPMQARTAPAAAEFQAANGAISTPSGRPATPPAPRRRTRPPRRYPPFSASGAPSARQPVPRSPMPPLHTPTVPPALRFHPATSQPASPPMHASGPPPPPEFQPATPDRAAVGRRARTHTPAPVVFQHPASHPPVTSPPMPRAPLPVPPPPHQQPIPHTATQRQRRR